MKLLIFLSVVLALQMFSVNVLCSGGDLSLSVYLRDLSEHCMRRAVPSVFLAEHVRSAMSETLLFSKAELPYNCLIAVKTESANDIVLVIQKVMLNDLYQACSQDSSQLLVFEMGETFGGYWGSMIKKNFEFDKKIEPHTVYYTKKTKKSDSSEQEISTERYNSLTTESEEEEEDTTTVETTFEGAHKKRPTTDKNMIVEEIPLLEIEGPLLQEAEEPWTSHQVETTTVYDVMPKKNKNYVTEIIPIVEIAVSEQTMKDGRRQPLYQLDYNEGSNTRINPRTSNPLFNKRLYTTRYRHFTTKLITKRNKTYKPFKFRDDNEVSRSSTADVSTTRSWDHLMDLLKNIDKPKKPRGDQMNLLDIRDTKNVSRTDSSEEIYTREIENVTHSKINKSNVNVKYSTTNVPTTTPGGDIKDTFRSVSQSTLERFEGTTEFFTKQMKEAETLENLEEENSTQAQTIQSPYYEDLEIKNSTDTTNGTNISTLNDSIMTQHKVVLDDTTDTTFKTILGSSTNIKESIAVTGAMVGHESWDNVVQAAPEMAIKLNHSTKDRIDLNSVRTIPGQQNIKKRHIQAVDIEIAKPHTWSTKASRAPRTTDESLEVSRSFEFARFVELEDEEIMGRVHLRYMRPFVGPMVYNICESVDESKQQLQRVHLFNSSRIVLAINNFTLNAMSLTVTTVRLIPTATMHCPTSHLECQVSGVRVCVDTCVSCDGVPNCGSGDTFDEDRHLCGGSALRYDVWLAAVTFLAVLSTMVYIVHYWIKRCVPKVSDAFFVYTDGAENVLYLDTIMRSPNEFDEMPRMFHGNMFDDGMAPNLHETKKSVLRTFFSKLIWRSRSKTVQAKEEQDMCVTQNNLPRNKINSFQAYEISKMGGSGVKDMSIQTGPSLELKCMPVRSKKPRDYRQQVQDKVEENLGLTMSPDHDKELNMVKLLQKERPERGMVTPRPSEELVLRSELSPQRSAGTEEEELQTTFYGSHRLSNSHKDVEYSVDTYDHKRTGRPSGSPDLALHAKKRLRFEEAATAIPSTSRELPSSDNIGTENPVEIHESPSAAKDFSWFWSGSNKTKKHKKKPLNTPR